MLEQCYFNLVLISLPNAIINRKKFSNTKITSNRIPIKQLSVEFVFYLVWECWPIVISSLWMWTKWYCLFSYLANKRINKQQSGKKGIWNWCNAKEQEHFEGPYLKCHMNKHNQRQKRLCVHRYIHTVYIFSCQTNPNEIQFEN